MLIMRRILTFILLILVAVNLCACGKDNEGSKETDIVITTELSPDEIFRLSDLSCTVPEANIYMRTTEDQYTSVFGPEILNKEIDGKTLAEQLKDTTISRLAQIKAMTLLSRDKEIVLSEECETKIDQAATEFMSSLSSEEVASLGVTKEIIANMYREYALATLVYDAITTDVNPEISDDEARAITVKDILIKTYSVDANGNKVEYTNSQKTDAQYLANRISVAIKDGENFDTLCDKYNEDEQAVYSFTKGMMPKEFEDVAFELSTDEISGVVKTEYGFHIMKCIETLNREETDKNKQKILKQRKNDAFNEVYDEFIKTIYSNFNDELWDSLKFEADSSVDTVNFFDIYNKYEITKSSL